MDITAIHQIFLTCTSVTTDSRNCPQGSLFIALKGESFNGNAFAARALESGSAYAIVDEEAYAPAGDTRYIVVENSLKTLQQLANYHRRQMRTPIIGITGTNGKTTTKELMSTVLSQTHNVLYTLGNLNNHIGVPLTLLRLRPEHDLAVVEMGASHPGDIKELVEIAEPDYGIITNVGKAHLEGFGSFEGIIKTKGEMYDYLRTRKEATIFIHNDNPRLPTAVRTGCTSTDTSPAILLTSPSSGKRTTKANITKYKPGLSVNITSPMLWQLSPSDIFLVWNRRK